MAIHELKTHVEPFTAVLLGHKLAEFRKDDRGFACGDTLVLREWDHEVEKYTGCVLSYVVTDVRKGPQFGIPEGYCMMSIKLICKHDARMHSEDPDVRKLAVT